MIPAWHYLVLSAVLFILGALGVVVRRNLVVIMMCIELMLNAVNLAFITFARMHGGPEGQVIAFLVIVLLSVIVIYALRRMEISR